MKIDADVKIPDAVKAAAAAAEQAYANAYSTPDAQTTNDDQANPPVETPSSEMTFSPSQTTTEAQPKVTPQVSDESWEHKFNSMKGRFERAQRDNAALAEQIASLQNVIATMQATQAPRVESQELRAERLITPEEENDYGPDFLNVVGKKAKEELLPELKKYQDEIASLRARLDGQTSYIEHDARTRMTNQLDASVPGWREQNTNQDFLAWLALPDPYSGAIRHNMLKAAWAANDAPRVAAFFRGFLAEEAATSPATGGQAPVETAAKVPLEQFAAPGRAKTAASVSAPAEKPVITPAFITRFYADVAAGRYKGRDEEKVRIEKSIFEATRDGRIR